MMEEILKITDKHGFIYQVKVKHTPHQGFSMACYDDRIIANCELGKIHQPYSDDDSEWEQYEDRFSEWRDEINSNLLIKCKTHFDNN